MFESIAEETPPPALDATRVLGWLDELQASDLDLDDAQQIDLIRALEQLACGARATQAVVTADYDADRCAERAERGVPAAQQSRGIAHEIALARRESPHRGQQHLSLARMLRPELPHTLAAFREGRITEFKATIVASETACLSVNDRRKVDRDLAGNPERIEAMGDQELRNEARKLAYKLDPEAFVERRRRAESDRRVTLRPAPDVMSQLSALLPVKDGVAVIATLTREADRLRSAGDPRSRGQIMADTLVQRVLTDTTPQRGRKPGLMINLVVSDAVLFGASDEAAHVDGYGPIPAELAREMVRDAVTDDETGAWLRRLYVSPATGSLTAMDSTSRFVPSGLAELLRLRDQTCRTPWCDAPIRHSDHVVSAARGGPTSATNGEGLCEACNLAKEGDGWSAQPRPGPRHRVVVTTPTGHTYGSTSPPLTETLFVETRPSVWTRVA